jgi:hypothetical protein
MELGVMELGVMELGVMELGGGVLRRWDAAVTRGRVTLPTLHLSTSTRQKPSLISTVHLHLLPSPKLGTLPKNFPHRILKIFRTEISLRSM